MVARQFHVFRSTQMAKKKNAVLDEDDEELEAELRELEREKRELESQERGEALKEGAGSSDAASEDDAGSSRFQELYDTILQKTTRETKQHELPAHSALYHLTGTISSKEQAQLIPQVVNQWRLKNLPITIQVSHKLVHCVCKVGSPETALELLGDREKYGLTPGLSTMRRVVRSFVNGTVEAGEGADEGLEKLDRAFLTMALIPYYNLSAGDALVYAQLTRGSLAYGGDEGLRRATVTMDEYLLIDGERQEPLSRKAATEVVAVADQLSAAYKAQGNAAKSQELEKHIASWKTSL
ncbi:hypothetical protein B0O80DRAFT_465323 [Mortierella sp. GBAus27b]|nr:hypothetical protein BGX31_006785 [Mortierella sp. GBA43]KAI8347522.1 hypothetical protein B0O80DRAFT_465323 [Mortierella sp. GBAus27b]